MHVLIETHAATAVLTIVVPRFNQAVSEQIGQQLRAAIRDDVQTYLVNLEHVLHISSAAVGVLVGLMKRVGRERRVELCAPSPAVRKVLRMTRMDAVFRIHPTARDGLARHFAPPTQTG